MSSFTDKHNIAFTHTCYCRITDTYINKPRKNVHILNTHEQCKLTTHNKTQKIAFTAQSKYTYRIAASIGEFFVTNVFSELEFRVKNYTACFPKK